MLTDAPRGLAVLTNFVLMYSFYTMSPSLVQQTPGVSLSIAKRPGLLV